MAWRLVPSLTRFRSEVDALWPNRDKRSDGTIGDAAHQATNSDHNPDADGSVDAWDMDNNIVPGDNAASDRIIYGVLIPAFQRHEAARYWIYQRKIAHRSDGWRVKAYTGISPHNEHVHWNSNQATENSTKPWLEGIDVDEKSISRAVVTWDLTPSGDPYTVGAALVDVKRLRAEVAALRSSMDSLKTPTLSDAQLAMLANKVVDALKSGAFRFEEE